jgi:hypothetical protein
MNCRAAFRIQIRRRLPPEAAVDLKPGDGARFADPVRHEPHDRAGSGAHVEAGHAGREPDIVEQSL